MPVKGRYVNMEYQRYARRYGVPLTMNSHFPIITLHLMRVVTGVQLRSPERLNDLLTAVFQAMWIDDPDLNDTALTSDTLANAGLSQAETEALPGDPQVKAALRATTEEAVSRGVFGAPTTFVDNEMFFGHHKTIQETTMLGLMQTHAQLITEYRHAVPMPNIDPLKTKFEGSPPSTAVALLLASKASMLNRR